MSALLPDSDSEDELPPAWEERATLDGSVYFVNHSTKETQWAHPRTGIKKRVTGDLPPGWERRVSDDGCVTFIDVKNQRRTYTDPRLAFATEEKEHAMDVRQRFDGSSTALQVLHGSDLSGKVFIVTGATNGIGLETARSLALHGAELILVGRSEATCKMAEDRILQERPGAKVSTIPMELSSLASVRRGAVAIRQKHKALDVMILNAGVLGMGWQLTEDNLEATFQINHLSHFYLILLLEDLLHKGSRIVLVSSESHRQANIRLQSVSEEKVCPSSPSGYWDVMAYNNSKLCQVLHAVELQRRLAHRNIQVFSVHPGNLVTTGLAKRSCLYRLLFMLVRPFTKSLQQAAATSVWAAIAPELTGCGGVYLNNCCICETSRAGQDMHLAQKLWQISEDILTRVLGPVNSSISGSSAKII